MGRCKLLDGRSARESFLLQNGIHAAVLCHQVATRPPSTGIVTPWTKLASSLAR